MMLLGALSTLRIKQKPWTKGKIPQFLFQWRILNAIFGESLSELLGLSALGISFQPRLVGFLFYDGNTQASISELLYSLMQLHFSQYLKVV